MHRCELSADVAVEADHDTRGLALGMTSSKISHQSACDSDFIGRGSARRLCGTVLNTLHILCA